MYICPLSLIHLNVLFTVVFWWPRSTCVTTGELYLSVLVCRLSDFVEATRSTFQENLEELGLGAGPFMFSYHEAASLMDTSAFHSPVSSPHSLSHPALIVYVCVFVCVRECMCVWLFPINTPPSDHEELGQIENTSNKHNFLNMSVCLSADIWIRMQLQQWRDGAVSDGGEAAANPDEAAQGEHALTDVQWLDTIWIPSGKVVFCHQEWIDYVVKEL